MSPAPSSKWFGLALVVSIAMLAFLALGYFGRVGVVLARTPPAGGHAVKTTTIHLDAGRVVFWTETDATPGGPSGGPPPPLRWERLRPRFPDLKRLVWEFDNHTMTGAKASTRVYIVAFPMWCLAVPFLIAPAIYLHRRVKLRREPAGFELVQP